MLILIDKLFRDLIVPEAAIEAEILHLKTREEIRDQSAADEVIEYMDAIDAKASGMLTHLSIFAAIAGFIQQTEHSGGFLAQALLVEFIFLLFLTIVCLRCLRILTTPRAMTNSDDMFRYNIKEMLYRRRLYIFVHEAGGLVTLSIIATTLFSYLN